MLQGDKGQRRQRIQGSFDDASGSQMAAEKIWIAREAAHVGIAEIAGDTMPTRMDTTDTLGHE